MFNKYSFVLFRNTRSSVLEESLQKLGVEKLSKEDAQKMQWEVLEAKIGNWIHFMRIAVKLLYAGEPIVCDQIFEGFDSLRDHCFGEVIASSVSVLLSFRDAIAKSKRLPEKLFVLLGMYEIMRELNSKVLFSFAYSSVPHYPRPNLIRGWEFSRPLVGSGKNPQKYIKYGAEDLERMLGDFFEGKNLDEPKR
ncbi:hypothetical protein SO802_009648 [Lithocarpus litseifolius]|uniref:Exocyst subunit Exo70 family protein n=1 Tax=Lithocarpus litseifolius TaxID=425828 RepID=A0AAW2DGB8_9ROSI